MKVNIQIKADILKTLMSEDRQEVRGLRASIYNYLSLFAGLSFVASPFLIEKFSSAPRGIFLLTDGVIVLFIWIIFLRLRQDLYHCRQCLEEREDLIKKLDETDNNEFDPLPDASKRIPKVTDSELWLLPELATAAIVLKSALIFILR